LISSGGKAPAPRCDAGDGKHLTAIREGHIKLLLPSNSAHRQRSRRCRDESELRASKSSSARIAWGNEAGGSAFLSVRLPMMARGRLAARADILVVGAVTIWRRGDAAPRQKTRRPPLIFRRYSQSARKTAEILDSSRQAGPVCANRPKAEQTALPIATE